jgi:threonine dehydrogenase-like Zn-dependent dehydrogenase
MPGVPSGVDWTPLWYKELTIRAAYAYGPERRADGTRDTFEVALDLMRTWAPRLVPLVGRPHELAEYREAFAAAINTGNSRTVKAVFAIHGR